MGFFSYSNFYRKVIVASVCPFFLSGVHSFSLQPWRVLAKCDNNTTQFSSTTELASSISSPNRPTTIFIHGLDSSKETWSNVLQNLISSGYPAIALDLRGHGESRLGSESDFCSKALSEDILAFISHQNFTRPVVLVGHSMGGLITIQILATEAEAVRQGSPRRIGAVVIEDIDVRKRSGPSPSDDILDENSKSQLQLFSNKDGGRLWPSWNAAYTALVPWYSADRVNSWKNKRIRQLPSGEWWSDISPWVQRIARRKVLATRDGTVAWDRMVEAAPLPFAVHLWVAGPGTACVWEGVDGVKDMARRLPEVSVRSFPNADHSIHNTASEEYLAELKRVIDSVL